MMKWLLLFMLLSTPAYALFTECHDGSGNLVKPDHPSAVCVTFSGHTTGMDTHDRVRGVLKSVNRKYIKWTTEPVEMTQLEKDAVNTAKLKAFKSRVRAQSESSIDEFSVEGNRLRAALLVMMQEINILRAREGLAPRTKAQLTTAIKNKISSKEADV